MWTDASGDPFWRLSRHVPQGGCGRKGVPMDSVNSLATQGTSTLSTVITVVLWVLTIIATWRIYEKADQAGWKSIIPIYSDYIRFKITFRSGWFFLLMLIPVLNIVIYIMLQNKLAKAFGHGIGFTLGLIFLPTLFTLILGFNSDTYQFPE